MIKPIEGSLRGSFYNLVGTMGAASAALAMSPPAIHKQEPRKPAELSAQAVEQSPMADNLDTRFELLGAKTETKIATINGRIDELGVKVDGMHGTLADLGNRFASVPADISFIKATLAHHATKTETANLLDKVGERLRNQLYIVGMAIIVVGLLLRFAPSPA